MSLPPLLLERLKQRRIIRDTPQNTNNEQTDDKPTNLESSSQDRRLGQSFDESIDEQEEIIAEDYSDDETTQEDNKTREVDNVLDDPDPVGTDDRRPSVSPSPQVVKDSEMVIKNSEFIESTIGCPNKYNIYHDCNQYCIDNFSKPRSAEPTMQQRKDLALILRTYPMSNEWTVVYDPGVCTFYFWNIISNQVSWLPPGMNGFISPSADQIRRSMRILDQRERIPHIV